MVVHSVLIHMIANGLFCVAANTNTVLIPDVSLGIDDISTLIADVRAGTIAVVDTGLIDMLTLISSGSKCSGDHGHCHHSGQNDRCNPRNSLLSQFYKTTSKIFCVSEKEESLSRYNIFLFFWQNARALHARSAEKLPEKQVQKRRRPAQEDAGCCSAFRAACRPRRIRSCSISTWELSG